MEAQTIVQIFVELWNSFNGPSAFGGILVTLGTLYFGPDRLSALFHKSSEVAAAAHKVLDKAADQAEKLEDDGGGNGDK